MGVELDETSATPKSTTFTLRLGFNVNVPSAFSFQLTLCTMTKQTKAVRISLQFSSIIARELHTVFKA